MAKRIYFTGVWNKTDNVHQWPEGMIETINDQFKGQPVTLVAMRSDTLRSKSQNGYWMGTFIPFLAEILHHHLGWDHLHPEDYKHRLDLHYGLLELVWGKDARYIYGEDGEPMAVEYLDPTVKSSAMKRHDFSAMMDRAHRWVIQYTGAKIPWPGEGGEVVYF